MPDAETIETMRRALGAELAVRRREAGFTQATLAPVTGYTRSTIANVEVGRQDVDRYFWTRVEEALALPRVFLPAFDRLETALRQSRGERVRSRLDARAGAMPMAPAESGTSEPATELPAADLGSGDLGLADIDLLCDLTEAERTALTPYLNLVAFEPGTVVIREGQPAEHVYFVARGRLTVHLGGEDTAGATGTGGRRLRTFGAGGVFGESALFDGSRRTASVVAQSAVACWVLPVRVLPELAASHPALHATLLRVAGSNLAKLLLAASDQLREAGPA